MKGYEFVCCVECGEDLTEDDWLEDGLCCECYEETFDISLSEQLANVNFFDKWPQTLVLGNWLSSMWFRYGIDQWPECKGYNRYNQ